MENRPPETHTPYSRPQVTAAQVETYQMTKISPEDHRRPSQQMDSSLSASPTATTPQRSIISSAQEAGRAHVLPDDRNLVNSGESPLLLSFLSHTLDTVSLGFHKSDYLCVVAVVL